jgi:hypothetical protein
MTYDWLSVCLWNICWIHVLVFDVGTIALQFVLGEYVGPLLNTISRDGYNLLAWSTLLVVGGGICLRQRRWVKSYAMYPTKISEGFVGLAIVSWFRLDLSIHNMLRVWFSCHRMFLCLTGRWLGGRYDMHWFVAVVRWLSSLLIPFIWEIHRFLFEVLGAKDWLL